MTIELSESDIRVVLVRYETLCATIRKRKHAITEDEQQEMDQYLEDAVRTIVSPECSDLHLLARTCLEEFVTEMQENVIPEVIKTIRARAARAAEVRHLPLGDRTTIINGSDVRTVLIFAATLTQARQWAAARGYNLRRVRFINNITQLHGRTLPRPSEYHRFDALGADLAMGALNIPDCVKLDGWQDNPTYTADFMEYMRSRERAQ